jgi:hypothetical protein
VTNFSPQFHSILPQDPFRLFRAIQLPGVNRHTSTPSPQHAHSDDVVEPVILLVAGLKDDAEMDRAVRLRRSARTDEDVCAVIRLKVVASVCREESVLVDKAPVGAEVGDPACLVGKQMSVARRCLTDCTVFLVFSPTFQPRPRKRAAGDGNDNAVAVRAVANRVGDTQGAIQRVEVGEARRLWRALRERCERQQRRVDKGEEVEPHRGFRRPTPLVW